MSAPARRSPKTGPEKGSVSASITDGALVEQGLADDVWALDALYRRHARSVGGMVTRLLGQREDAADIVHDSFVEAFTKLEQLRKPDAFRAWVMQIAVTRVRQHLRRRARRSLFGLRHVPEEMALESLVSGEADPAVHAELALLSRILERVSTEERIAWTLRYVEECEMQEVADLSGCSLATAKRRVRAVQRKVAHHGLDRTVRDA